MPSAQRVLEYYKNMYDIHSAAYLAGERWDKRKLSMWSALHVVDLRIAKSTAELDAETCTPQLLDPEECPSQPAGPSVGKTIVRIH